MSAQKFIFYGLIAAVAIFCGLIAAVAIFKLPEGRLNEITTAQPVSTTTQSASITNLSLHPNLKLIPLQECGNIAFDKISGGQSTEIFQFPWMVVLQRLSKDNQPEFFCGGTLISRRYVLTAAHCLRSIKGEIKIHSVVVGEHDTTTDPDCDEDDVCAEPIQEIPVEQSISHPNFQVSLYINDNGLVRLQWAVQFSYSVAPICLPYAEQFQIKDSDKVLVTGWGGTETGRMSNVLLLAILDVTQNSECLTIYNKTYHGRLLINENYLCAIAGKSDTCPGDSGGPAVAITDT